MFKKPLSLTVIICFFLTSLGPLPKAHADTVLGLPAPGTMISLSSAYEPVMIKGLTVHKDNPFLFDFIVDVGQDKMSGQPLKKEGEKLIKYFLASLAIPDRDRWVNLSPYEKNRMIPESLGQTDMGRDLLEQDYILKQITASLIYPEKQLGKTFWDKVYAKAQQTYGTTQIPVNTFNKVWIMADKAEVFEHNQTAFVVGQHLKVMLEEDYLALTKHADVGVSAAQGNNQTHSIASQIVKQIVLPELEKEVNTGKNFANLRQIFNSVILSTWYKKNLKEALLNQVYADQSKVKGINLNDPTVKQQIYEQYLKAYKKGVFNYIKEDVNAGGDTIPRKYFSGGELAVVTDEALTVSTDPQEARKIDGLNGEVKFEVLASPNGAKSSPAMTADDLITTIGELINDLPSLFRWDNVHMFYRIDGKFFLHGIPSIAIARQAAVGLDNIREVLKAAPPEMLQRVVKDSRLVNNRLTLTLDFWASRDNAYDGVSARAFVSSPAAPVAKQIQELLHSADAAMFSKQGPHGRNVLEPRATHSKFGNLQLGGENVSTQAVTDAQRSGKKYSTIEDMFNAFGEKPVIPLWVAVTIPSGGISTKTFRMQVTDISPKGKYIKGVGEDGRQVTVKEGDFLGAQADAAMRVPNPFGRTVMLADIREFKKLVEKSGLYSVFYPIEEADLYGDTMQRDVAGLEPQENDIVLISQDGDVDFFSYSEKEAYNALQQQLKRITFPKKTVDELYSDAAMEAELTLMKEQYEASLKDFFILGVESKRSVNNLGDIREAYVDALKGSGVSDEMILKQLSSIIDATEGSAAWKDFEKEQVSILIHTYKPKSNSVASPFDAAMTSETTDKIDALMNGFVQNIDPKELNGRDLGFEVYSLGTETDIYLFFENIVRTHLEDDLAFMRKTQEKLYEALNTSGIVQGRITADPNIGLRSGANVVGAVIHVVFDAAMFSKQGPHGRNVLEPRATHSKFGNLQLGGENVSTQAVTDAQRSGKKYSTIEDMFNAFGEKPVIPLWVAVTIPSGGISTKTVRMQVTNISPKGKYIKGEGEDGQQVTVKGGDFLGAQADAAMVFDPNEYALKEFQKNEEVYIFDLDQKRTNIPAATLRIEWNAEQNTTDITLRNFQFGTYGTNLPGWQLDMPWENAIRALGASAAMTAAERSIQAINDDVVTVSLIRRVAKALRQAKSPLHMDENLMKQIRGLMGDDFIRFFVPFTTLRRNQIRFMWEEDKGRSYKSGMVSEEDFTSLVAALLQKDRVVGRNFVKKVISELHELDIHDVGMTSTKFEDALESVMDQWAVEGSPKTITSQQEESLQRTLADAPNDEARFKAWQAGILRIKGKFALAPDEEKFIEQLPGMGSVMQDIIDGINDKTAWWLLNDLPKVSSANVALDALNKALALWLGTEDWQKKRVQVEPPEEGQISPRYEIVEEPVADLSTKLKGFEPEEVDNTDEAMATTVDEVINRLYSPGIVKKIIKVEFRFPPARGQMASQIVSFNLLSESPEIFKDALQSYLGDHQSNFSARFSFPQPHVVVVNISWGSEETGVSVRKTTPPGTLSGAEAVPVPVSEADGAMTTNRAYSRDITALNRVTKLIGQARNESRPDHRSIIIGNAMDVLERILGHYPSAMKLQGSLHGILHRPNSSHLGMPDFTDDLQAIESAIKRAHGVAVKNRTKDEVDVSRAMTVLDALLRDQQRLTQAKMDAEYRLQAARTSGGQGNFEVSELNRINSQLQAIASRISKERAADRAELTPVRGGIDLNTSNGMQWKVSKDGNGVEMNIDPAMIARIRREGIDSLSPVILKMTPVTSIWPLMGLQAPA